MLPWSPKIKGGYHASFEIEVAEELPVPPRHRWAQIKNLTGITQSPQLFPKVPEPGLATLRALLGAQITGIVDYLFLPRPEFEWLGQNHRHVANRAIAYRRGQSVFRRDLMYAYSSVCAVTGTTASDVLEAAHIYPYRGAHTNRVDNGLLLRADIHTLFDLNMPHGDAFDDGQGESAPGLIGLCPPRGPTRPTSRQSFSSPSSRPARLAQRPLRLAVTTRGKSVIDERRRQAEGDNENRNRDNQPSVNAQLYA